MNRAFLQPATPKAASSLAETGGRTVGEGGAPLFEWAVLVSLAVHPIKVAIIEALAWICESLSATDLKKIFDEQFRLAAISYHLEKLEEAGVVVVVRERAVRGATETFFYFQRIS